MGLVDFGGCLEANWRGKFAGRAVLHGPKAAWPGWRELGVVVMGIKGAKGQAGLFGRRSGRRAAKRLRKAVLWGGVDLRR